MSNEHIKVPSFIIAVLLAAVLSAHGWTLVKITDLDKRLAVLETKIERK